ncbi:hypothetical protein [Umezawaea sp.]|uniref:hypothetical protein n=1 Tax=Umezawaea sp. TaxID=1955258 RepID=UPI002ED2FBF8
MPLSKIAAQFAAEIKNHDWSDAPWRNDRAGHQRPRDNPGRDTKFLSDGEAANIRMNVMWVTAQVLGYNDPNFDAHEFADACGVRSRNNDGSKSGIISHGFRYNEDGSYAEPGGFPEMEQ